MIKKFIELFGECLEDDKEDLQEYVIQASASKIEGLISLKGFYKEHAPRETFYNFTELPRVMEKKNQVVALGNKFFPYERVKKVLENFFTSNVEIGLYHGREASALIFKLDEEYGIMMANKVEKEKKDPDEVLYRWNDLFFHKEFGDDMEL